MINQYYIILGSSTLSASARSAMSLQQFIALNSEWIRRTFGRLKLLNALDEARILYTFCTPKQMVSGILYFYIAYGIIYPYFKHCTHMCILVHITCTIFRVNQLSGAHMAPLQKRLTLPTAFGNLEVCGPKLAFQPRHHLCYAVKRIGKSWQRLSDYSSK